MLLLHGENTGRPRNQGLEFFEIIVFRRMGWTPKSPCYHSKNKHISNKVAGDVDTLWNFQHDLRITPTPGHQDSRFQGPTVQQCHCLRLKSLSAWLIWTRVVVLATPSQPGHSQAVWFQVSRVYHFNSRYSVTIDRVNKNKVHSGEDGNNN